MRRVGLIKTVLKCVINAQMYTKQNSTQDREREAVHSWHTEGRVLLLSTAAWTPEETTGAQQVRQPALESIRVKSSRAPRDPAAWTRPRAVFSRPARRVSRFRFIMT